MALSQMVRRLMTIALNNKPHAEELCDAVDSAMSGGMLPVADTTAIVCGSADATKCVRIEADGLTTGTTRVLTPLDKDYTLEETGHAAKHKSGGGDAIKLDELAATTDVTTLNASTSAHGLLRKLDNDATNFLNGQGAWATPAAGDTLPVTDTTAIAKGSSDATKRVRFEVDGFTTGTTRVLTPLDKDYTLEETSHAAKHKSGGADTIKLDELAAPTDVTTLNASTSAHGLLLKLSNVATQFLNGQGAWAAPAASDILPATDTTAIAKGSSDSTKQVRFEVDGFTTSTTRVLTPLNKDYTLEETGHASKHVSGGSDSIKLDDLAATDDNTDLNASTSAHGLLRKLDNTATHFLDGTGAWATVPPARVFTPLDNQPPASNYAVLGSRNSHPTLEFDDTTNWDAVFGGVVPPNYAGGGCVVTVMWMATTATSGNVIWQGAWEALAAAGQDLDADGFASAQSSSTDATSATSGVLTYSTITFTDGAQMDSVAAGGAFRLKITRNAASGSDTMGGRAQVVRVLVKFN